MSEYSYRETIIKGIETGSYEVYDIATNEVYENFLSRGQANGLAARLTMESIREDGYESKLSELRQQIADLQAENAKLKAENAKLKADCASYDKVLNDVAIGYLEATEKLQQVEAKESPALESLGDSSIVWNMAYDEAKPKTVEEIASELIKDGHELGVTTLAHLRFEKQFAKTRVRVNWSGNGFSSGSYRLVSSFSKFGRNWHTIEVITDKVMQYTVNAEKCEIVS